VPPKGLFPSPAPSNLITVTSCRKCNEGYSKDEEYFRVIVTSLAGTEHHPDAKALFQSKIIRGLERRPKLATKVMATIVPVDIYCEEKKIGTVPAYDICAPEFDRVMVKLLRGLLHHETGLLVPSDFFVRWDVILTPLTLPPGLFAALQNCPLKSFGEGVFRYQVYVSPGTAGSFWLLSFYDGVVFHGGIYPNRSANAKKQSRPPEDQLAPTNI